MSRQPVDTARMMAGLLDLLAASQVASGELGRSATASEAGIFRVLGARQVLQGVVTAHCGHRRADVVVDVLHGISMIGLALAGPRSLRRGALTQATVATTFTIWGAISTVTNTKK